MILRAFSLIYGKYYLKSVRVNINQIIPSQLINDIIKIKEILLWIKKDLLQIKFKVRWVQRQ